MTANNVTSAYSGEVATVQCGNTSNVTNTTGCTEAVNSTFGRNEELAKIEIAVQGVILALAVFGNSTVLLVLATQKKKLSRMNMMIAHLSLADLFVAFFNVLPQLIWDITYRFYGGDFLCRSVKYLQVVAMYASSYVLVTTAVDRYLAIVHPLTAHTWTSRKMHLLVSAAWLLSLLFSLPQLAIFSYREVTPGSGVYDCWGVFDPMWTLQLYVTWITLAIYILPFLLLVLAYGRICYVVWKSMKYKEITSDQAKLQIANGLLKHNVAGSPVALNVRAHMRGVSKAKVKTVKLTLTVIACYLLCWGPFFISQMWAAWDPMAPFTGDWMTIMMLLASLNSCCNPWIYLAFSADTWRKLLMRKKRHQSTVTSESRYPMTVITPTEIQMNSLN